MSVDPPCAGDDFRLPRVREAHAHASRLRESLGRDGPAPALVLDHASSGSVDVCMHVDVVLVQVSKISS